MKIKVGDVIGLFNEISGYRVERVGKVIRLEDGRDVQLSDVFICATYNEDGSITKTYYDGLSVVEGPDDDYRDRDDAVGYRSYTELSDEEIADALLDRALSD